MTSVERVLEYCALEPEAPTITEKRPPSDWPSTGNILFKGMSLKYAPHLKNVLHSISCYIRPNEKVRADHRDCNQPFCVNHAIAHKSAGIRKNLVRNDA